MDFEQILYLADNKCKYFLIHLSFIYFSGVVEAYEKTICELIAEKEQLVQTYEKKCADIKNESELNANHLASLEMTFSDLHA